MVSSGTTQKRRKAPATVRPAARRGTGSHTVTEKPAAGSGYDAFLNHTFDPVLFEEFPQIKELFSNPSQTEQDFFNSVFNFIDAYKLQFDLKPYERLPYPANIQMVYEALKRRLKQIEPSLQLIIVQDDSGKKTALATVAEYDTNNTLLYIPTRPFYQCMVSKKRKARTQIIACLFDYMLTRIMVPFYLQSGSFLEWMAETIIEDYEGEKDEESVAVLKQTKKILRKGKRCLKWLTRNAKPVSALPDMLKRFRCIDESDKHLIEVAGLVVEFNAQFGQSPSIWNSYHTDIIPDYVPDDMQEEVTRMTYDSYVGFIWDDDDPFCERANEFINQEWGSGEAYFEQPQSILVFHEPVADTTHTLEYEKMVFALFDKFIFYLYQIK